MTVLEVEQGSTGCALFVLKLGRTVTEASLYTYLSDNFGIRVKSIRICRRHEDGVSLGHGYINCFDSAQKDVLKEKFDGHLLEGCQRVRAIEVCKDPKARKAELKHANVFIQNLPFGIHVSQLEPILLEFGHIVSSKIPPPRPGKDSAVAYVQFGSQAAANALILKAQRGSVHIGNVSISATQYLPYEQRVQNRNEEFTNLYVKNLPEEVHFDDDLRNLFSKYGAIKSVRLQTVCLDEHMHNFTWAVAHSVMMQDLTLGRRFGFVNFETCKDAKVALKEMHGVILGNATKPVYVARFQSKTERQAPVPADADPYYYSPFPMRPVPDNLNMEGRNIYVKHLAPDVDEMNLLTIFQNCGPVESVKVMRDQNSCLSRGFGFVCFAYPQSAAAAIGCMQGYDLNGYRLYVSMSKPAKVASRYRRSTRSARELMQAWQPAYEEAAYIEYPMPTNKAFLQVNPIHKTLTI